MMLYMFLMRMTLHPLFSDVCCQEFCPHCPFLFPLAEVSWLWAALCQVFPHCDLHKPALHFDEQTIVCNKIRLHLCVKRSFILTSLIHRLPSRISGKTDSWNNRQESRGPNCYTLDVWFIVWVASVCCCSSSIHSYILKWVVSQNKICHFTWNHFFPSSRSVVIECAAESLVQQSIISTLQPPLVT